MVVTLQQVEQEKEVAQICPLHTYTKIYNAYSTAVRMHKSFEVDGQWTEAY